jgi:hypothetical protein
LINVKALPSASIDVPLADYEAAMLLKVAK